MKTSYMSQFEIQQLAEAALISYEFTASWSRAFEAAKEFAADELGIKATTAQAEEESNEPEEERPRQRTTRQRTARQRTVVKCIKF